MITVRNISALVFVSYVFGIVVNTLGFIEDPLLDLVPRNYTNSSMYWSVILIVLGISVLYPILVALLISLFRFIHPELNGKIIFISLLVSSLLVGVWNMNDGTSTYAAFTNNVIQTGPAYYYNCFVEKDIFSKGSNFRSLQNIDMKTGSTCSVWPFGIEVGFSLFFLIECLLIWLGYRFSHHITYTQIKIVNSYSKNKWRYFWESLGYSFVNFLILLPAFMLLLYTNRDVAFSALGIGLVYLLIGLIFQLRTGFVLLYNFVASNLSLQQYKFNPKRRKMFMFFSLVMAFLSTIIAPIEGNEVVLGVLIITMTALQFAESVYVMCKKVEENIDTTDHKTPNNAISSS